MHPHHSSASSPRFVSTLTRGLAAALLVASLASVSAFAGAPDAAVSGWGRDDAYGKLYDPAREVYVPGTVLQVERFAPAPGMAEGVRAFVNAGRESLWVHLGPAAFVEAQTVQVGAGDAIAVTGALTTIDSQHTVLAAKIEKSGHTLKLRDTTGQPAWSNFHPRAAH